MGHSMRGENPSHETMFSNLNRLDIIVLVICSLMFGMTRTRNKQKRISNATLPPGPVPIPFLGNTLDMPRKDDRLVVTEWGKQYGDLVMVTLLGGRKVIFLNSAKAAVDLFEKRSRIYSDRPQHPLISESVGVDWNMALIPHNEVWRRQRKVFVSRFGIRRVGNYKELQESMTRQTLHRLLKNPEDFLELLHLHAGQTIMKVVYNIDVESGNDRCIQNVLRVFEVLSEASRPIAHLIDSMPISTSNFFKHIHYFWPGVLRERSVARMRADTEDMLNVPFSFVKTRMAQGIHEPSYVADLLENQEAEGLDEELIIKSAGVAYAAGAESSAASTAAFMLAMINYPEVQEKAQAEIDKVIGRQRLPTFSDRESLPYIYAIYKEVLRWHTVVPQGVPRVLREDDTYGGYLLPAGCSVISNTWGILHDPAIFPDPMAFKPERYFSSDGELDLSLNDPERYAFGYGRRICAGMHFAENSLWIFIAQMLATTKISHKLDTQGRKIAAHLRPTQGLVSQPGPFQCSIVPRFEQAISLLVKE
ncbi:cytochrome P450 [Schizopora paradoxa]|uniref:Cytochrome P450 n=1 Tax=Schizopora paradoxa TaxID=27342 RepID=A0A0H2SKR2_9AGAM|nr:cytochrome P450 [Schizopora paradoxa]